MKYSDHDFTNNQTISPYFYIKSFYKQSYKKPISTTYLKIRTKMNHQVGKNLVC